MGVRMLSAGALRSNIYGVPTYLFTEALLNVMRGEKEQAQELVRKHKQQGTIQLDDLQQTRFVSMRSPATLEEASEFCASLIAPQTDGAISLPQPTTARVLLDRIALRFLATQPETLSDKRLLEPIGLKSHNGYLSNSFSESTWRRKFDLARMDLEDISKLTDESLTTQEKETLEVVRFVAETNLLYEKDDGFLCNFPANQVDGVPFMMTMIFTEVMSLDEDEDGQLYNQRLGNASEIMKELAEYITFQHSKGYAMPGFACDKVVEMLDSGFCGDAVTAEKTPFGSRLASCTTVSESLKEEGLKIINESLIPAYKALRDAVASSRPDKSLDDKPPGLHRLRSGESFYIAELRNQTTTSFTPQEIHNLGLQKVAMIKDQMKQVLVKQLSQPEDVNPIEFMRKINEMKDDSRFFYKETEKDQCIADFKNLVAESERLCASKFNILPKTPCKVLRVPEHMEKGAPAAFYWPPSLDGSRPGAFYANVGQISAVQKFEMRTLTAHEAVPGHHFQLALAAENTNSHILRKIEYVNLNAFWEGWALHAELLAGECGYYDKSPYDWMGHYGDALFRAARLVVDTGLHCASCRKEGAFTREEAVQYMLDNTTLDSADIGIEVNRYITFPAQACGYMVGKICMEEEREKWATTGGNDISFHDYVLSTCGLPLDALRTSLQSASK